LRILRQQPPQPLILIANDPYSLSSDLRKNVDMISFRRLSKNQIAKVLERICHREGVRCDRETLRLIAENAGGDLRAAINDLQAIADGKDTIKPDDVVTGKRLQELDIFRFLQKVFKTKIPAHSDTMLLDESPEDLIMWIEENLPLEYDGKMLYRAYNPVSRADIFLGRVRRRQFYRLWKYSTYLMTTGLQSVRKEAKRGFTKYSPPSLWRKMAYARKRREKLREILKKIGKYSHMSSKKAMEQYYIIKFLFENLDIEKTSRISLFYSFSKDELEFMIGDEKAEKISRFIEERNLHKVEDETFLTRYGEKEDIQEEENRKEEVKTDHGKKQKTVTLDAFFGED